MEPDCPCDHYTYDDHEYIVDQAKIGNISHKILSLLGVESFDLSLEFVSPAEMTDLNSEYRSKDRSTDVLSFPQFEFEAPVTIASPAQFEPNIDGPPRLLGDVLISLVDAEKNSADIGQSLDREVCFLIVHGILHLCGHDHIEPEEEKIMLQQQKLIMEALESEPPSIWINCARPGK